MTKLMLRPKLDWAPVPELLQPGKCYITCNPGQWDNFLNEAYQNGWTLLEIEEVDGREKPVRAWKKRQ